MNQMTPVQKKLFLLKDEKYADFQSGLIPGISRNLFIGVRVPVLRKLAAEIKDTPECRNFLRSLPHGFYDENMLHAVLLSGIKDFDEALAAAELFLPFVDCWAVCDTLIPKIFASRKDVLLRKIREWCGSGRTYTCRFGIKMLMTHFLDRDFRPEYLEIPAGIVSSEYYVNMMTAWFFAEALARQRSAAEPYITERKLTPWVHNRTIQKAVESFRITEEQKACLKTQRIPVRVK